MKVVNLPRCRFARSMARARAIGVCSTILIALCCLATSACSTHMVPLTYEGGPFAFPEGPPAPNVTVGTFDDERGTDPNWLGAIRGGYGNPLKKLRTNEPTSVVVEKAFREAVDRRGRLSTSDDANFLLRGRIQKLDCSYYFNKEAHARIEVDVLRLPSRELAHSKVYKASERRGGVGAGILGSVDGLRQIAEQVLRRVVDDALSDPELLAVLSQDRPPMSGTTETRLLELDALRDRGLLTEQEYRSKRNAILEDL